MRSQLRLKLRQQHLIIQETILLVSGACLICFVICSIVIRIFNKIFMLELKSSDCSKQT